ncbi:MAG: glutathione S-transferase family protein [Myxococcota bacterium]|nr:glutathione S-transferase family protein [Myxococcota bacterium]
MGLLIDGLWHDKWYDTESTGGRFVRSESQFRHWVTADGRPGPTGAAGFKAEPNRYHLYVSHACPWAHRTMIVRQLKGLEGLISTSVVNWVMREHGWTFAPGPGVEPDPVMNADYMHQVYTASCPNYTGRVTVPVLWDRKTNQIVSNESSDIIRMFNDAFDDCGARSLDLYPVSSRKEIDRWNKEIYASVNNGVYKAGFATDQAVYEAQVKRLFSTLETIETSLGQTRFLTGSQITEADWRLFTTLVRFDAVYVGHFKCNLKRLIDFPNLWGYTRALYQQPGIQKTVHMDHIKGHYYQSHPQLNPTAIVPSGPELDFDLPHNR